MAVSNYTRFIALSMIVLSIGSCSPRKETAGGVAIHGEKLCGDGDIRGERVADIDGAGQCGIDHPVRVSFVDGVALQPSATLSCEAAKSLKNWVSGRAKKAVKRNKGGKLTELSIAASYSCRGRNGNPNAKLSEHSFGKAIDISAVTTTKKGKVTVLEGWDARKTKKMMRALHESACGPFGTVLGPEANRYHKDHFHFDTAYYSKGAHCE